MAKIKITDLPKDVKVSKEEMKKVLGGAFGSPRAFVGFGIPSRPRGVSGKIRSLPETLIEL